MKVYIFYLDDEEGDIIVKVLLDKAKADAFHKIVGGNISMKTIDVDDKKDDEFLSKKKYFYRVNMFNDACNKEDFNVNVDYLLDDGRFIDEDNNFSGDMTFNCFPKNEYLNKVDLVCSKIEKGNIRNIILADYTLFLEAESAESAKNAAKAKIEFIKENADKFAGAKEFFDSVNAGGTEKMHITFNF